ncbi:hypothetical protein BGZ49_006280, partial [Haplosporangium sp. Z 27]
MAIGSKNAPVVQHVPLKADNLAYVYIGLDRGLKTLTIPFDGRVIPPDWNQCVQIQFVEHDLNVLKQRSGLSGHNRKKLFFTAEDGLVGKGYHLKADFECLTIVAFVPPNKRKKDIWSCMQIVHDESAHFYVEEGSIQPLALQHTKIEDCEKGTKTCIVHDSLRLGPMD